MTSLFSICLFLSASWFAAPSSARSLPWASNVHLAARDLTPASKLPGNWTYQGCYSDSTGSRTLSNGGYNSGNQMTGEVCISYCSQNGFIYAGTEYAGECYCGARLSSTATESPDSDCNMACNGDAAQACGGPGRLTVYWNGQSPAADPIVNPGPAGWKSLGCYEDGGSRTLSQGVAVQGDLTVAKCTAACKAGKYKYAGVEYSYECYCGNTIDNGHGPKSDGCTMTCKGNSTEFCGGANRINLYGPPDAVQSSAPNSQPSPTVDPGTAVDRPNTDAPVPAQTTPSEVDVATTPTGAVATAAPRETGSANQLPQGWTYAGCYVDGQYGRILVHGPPDSDSLTINGCVSTCVQMGYSVAGMEYSRQCFCDNYIRNGALNTTDSDCSMACSGAADQKCGGPDRVSVYGQAPVKIIQRPEQQTDNLPGNFKYIGCRTDDSGGTRTLPYKAVYANTNNATTCLTSCMTFGYNAGGMEYGEECYCGDPDMVPAGTTFVDDSECNTPCPGNPEAFCGAGNRMSYYEYQGDQLQVWNYPSGNDAGRYEFLIYAPTVALITTLGVNGKVTFQEKFGTQYNGTGSYEFDPFYEDNYDAAWREMIGLRTDIFCAAGLVLPDRAGRQVTFGGWAGTSTMGIRLYWPDGAPGEQSVNDWEENADELQLQNGRWYPSAMQMANGSILIVGGETGSNGPAVPTIEIVPRVGPVLTMDWLQRTDPLNLYPFLVVLPGGGIFVGYYNEARILDENTMATIKTLPNIPGAVNNPLGGRTYPLEGTLMIFPQHAPYTDPLEVLICGGSTPGYPVPLDNCVSTQPEAANPQWTIERMPSKRVLSCMTALPDGTFLILNGAHFGVAGFGLASDPNFNALLYDPRKPVNQRISVMANTTIPRLYHSEALLLPDGRVLVSGSNPDDGPDAVSTNEYRVEVFLPPYLLSGLPRPTFTLPSSLSPSSSTAAVNTTAIPYASTFTLTLTSALSSPLSSLRISLLGTTSNTHGNTFGQRTFFPEFSCRGNTCTVTAPPDAHVCPPGWFMVFVLDGQVPSVGQFVRIGGDVGGLGDWPRVEGFVVPGV
ncbi:WSC-domain-containing protein [Pseudovirgaria hyperparasitica]|uniref:WSC-domain-containing protein n=1 Tax=Pseudovirgaria hyperparasitica TaxID=470096 RepID=A0A6A6WI59_9PEZI|nr:WSC-domain-containing protein [Pseudovirgaria hyperparasitica]KAF2761337.1 WSC-domain-containing protein [Pseudovirgaria hyperparasitica]